MKHTFECNNEYFLYDIESGALHELEKAAFDIINGNTLGYDKKQIEEVNSEIEQLRKLGEYESVQPDISASPKSGVVKALCIHLSHDCNLRCKYCFADSGAYHGERLNMPLDTAKAAIDFLIEKSGTRHNLEVDFFGGEPLMNYDVLQKTVEYGNAQAKKHGKFFKFTTTTNGVLLDEVKCKYLNDTMDNVVLSLDGRKEVHDKARPTVNGKGSYDVVVDKFKYFRSIRGDKSYYIRGTFTHDNLDFSQDILAMRDEGFDQLSVEPVVLPDSSPMHISSADLPVIYEQYEKLAKQYVEDRLDSKKWFSFFHFVIDLLNGPCYKKRLVGCGAGSEYMAVTPDGNIYPCHQFAGEKDFVLGNVFDKQLDEAKRDLFRNSNLFTKPKCADCWVKYHCSGGCSANSIHFNGDINVPYEVACQIMRKRIECALYVYAKEHC